MLKLTACRCTQGEWKRARRAAWLRTIFPTRRLFECGACGRHFLVRPGAADAGDKHRAPTIVMFVASAMALGFFWVWWSSSDAQATGTTMSASTPLLHAANTVCSRVHVFKQGETLEKIAEQELGNSFAWQQIRIANRWLDLAPNGLEPGARLVVPVPCNG